MSPRLLVTALASINPVLTHPINQSVTEPKHHSATMASCTVLIWLLHATGQTAQVETCECRVISLHAQPCITQLFILWLLVSRLNQLMAPDNLQAHRLDTSQFTLDVTKSKLVVQVTNQWQMGLNCNAKLLP